MNLEVVQVCECTIEDKLIKLIDITYTNKIHLLFDSLSLINSKILCVWLGVVTGWMTFWKVSQDA